MHEDIADEYRCKYTNCDQRFWLSGINLNQMAGYTFEEFFHIY